MKTIKLNENLRPFFVGYEGENDARGFAFDYSAWSEEYGSGVLQMLLQRQGDADPYPVVLSAGEDGTAIWTPSATDTAVRGSGEIQLIYTVDEVVAKTAVVRVLIDRSLGASGDPPEPYENWLDRLTELAGATQQNAADAAAAATAAAQSASDAQSYISDAADEADRAEQAANDASGYATNAAASATSAASSAGTATTKAGEAVQSANAASGSASAAAQSASSASSSATAASGSASAAAGSATNASNSATSAATSATAANTAKTAAETAKTAAETAKTAAETAQASVTAAANTFTNTTVPAATQAINDEGERVLATIPEDYTELTGEVEDLKSAFTANLIHDTATGAIAHFEDGAALPVRDLSVDIEPVQNLNGYDNPWPAGGGKNKTDWTTDYVPTVGINNGITKMFRITLAAGTYTFSCKQSVSVPSSARNTIVVSVGSNSYQYESTAENFNPANLRHTKTFTVSEESICYFWIWSNNPSVAATYNEWQVESGSSFTSFAPYSNLCPISGHTDADVTRTGKNLCKSIIQGFPNQGNHTIKIDNDTESGVFYAVKGRAYVRSASIASNRAIIAHVNTDNVVDGTPYTEIETSDATTWTAKWTGWTVWYYYNAKNTDVEATLQIELGSTASAYEEYRGTTYPIPLGQTVYGGTLDVLTGVLTVDKIYRLLNDSAKWVENSSGNFQYSEYYGDRKTFPTSYEGIICSAVRIAYTVGGLYCRWNSANGYYFRIIDERSVPYTLADVQAMATNGDISICYELATPIEITLTPTEISTLLGTNNIFADCGDTTVDYYADPTLYINKKIAAAVAAMS